MSELAGQSALLAHGSNLDELGIALGILAFLLVVLVAWTGGRRDRRDSDER